MNCIREEARDIPIVADAEVVVLDGGPAGIASAVSAAKTGASTILLERYGFLGGMGTAAMVTNFCGLFANVHGEITRVVHGIADEVVDRLKALDGLNEPQITMGRTAVQSYDVGAYKCAADDLVAAAGVQLRLHSLAVGVVKRDHHIEPIVLESKSGRSAIRGQVFVDCSGDADLAAWAGAPSEKGDERGFLQYPTMMFRLGNVDTARAEADGEPQLRVLMAEAQASGDWKFPRLSPVLRPQAHQGEWRANMTQISRDGHAIDGTNVDDLTYAEIEGRRQVQLYHRFLRASVPGFEHCYIQEIAPQVGIRETRRIVGHRQLTVDDVLSNHDFEDTIGVNGWPIEKHVLGRIEFQFIEGRGYHQIPYGCLLPRDVDNLLVAGRCLSATPDAQASVRVSGPCFEMGQAAGIAAAMSAHQGCSPTAVNVPGLQQKLLASGAFLGQLSVAPTA